MLIEFRVENYRSLREEQVLTLEADKGPEEDDARPREEVGYSKPLLPVAVIYGGNASGKSNVLSAIAYMRGAVIESHRGWSPEPEEGVPLDPFAWGEKKEEPSHFETVMLVNGVRYEYGFSATAESFTEEWLYAFPKGKKQAWFERDPGNVFKYGDSLKGEYKTVEQVTRPNSLFLSAAAQNRHAQLSPIYSWFASIRPINVNLNFAVWQRPSVMATNNLIAAILDNRNGVVANPDHLANRFRTMLHNADLGISDVKVVKSEIDPATKRPSRPTRFLIKHEGPYADAWLPLEEESAGTKTLFRIGAYILQALENGGILVVDELEASLHPCLARELVRMFNDPKSNPNNAQLIFSTHDTNLLGTTVGEAALRRDQVWLTEKKDGATVLYPLTDYKPRNGENLERGYLQGRYGAIPFLGNFIPVPE